MTGVTGELDRRKECRVATGTTAVLGRGGPVPGEAGQRLRVAISTNATPNARSKAKAAT